MNVFVGHSSGSDNKTQPSAFFNARSRCSAFFCHLKRWISALSILLPLVHVTRPRTLNQPHGPAAPRRGHLAVSGLPGTESVHGNSTLDMMLFASCCVQLFGQRFVHPDEGTAQGPVEARFVVLVLVLVLCYTLIIFCSTFLSPKLQYSTFFNCRTVDFF